MSRLLLMLRVPTEQAECASALKDRFARDYGLRNFAYDATRLHITLMRGATGVEELQVQEFRWTMNDFALVHSVNGRYVELGRWTLSPPAAS